MWAKRSNNLYQLKVTLIGTQPPIWRRLLVRGDATLLDLHNILQVAMGWTDSHLHQFVTGRDTCFSHPVFELDDAQDERRVRLDDLHLAPKSKFKYEYDFGDGWEHVILVEKVTQPDILPEQPQCLTGRLACPPEDCGGVWDYYDLLEIMENPKHPEHEERLEWLGRFDPQAFDTDRINKMLKSMFRRRAGGAKRRRL